MNAPHDNSLSNAGQCDALLDAPPAAAGNDAQAQLAGKLQPLADSGRLDNLVDLLALASDLVDLLDAPMVEKLGALSEQATGAAWTLSNAWRAAQAQGLQEARPPGPGRTVPALPRRGHAARAGAGAADAARPGPSGGRSTAGLRLFLMPLAGPPARAPLSKTKPRKRLPAGLLGCAPGMGEATGFTATCA